MPFCPTCGTQIAAGAACPKCATAGTQPAATAAAPSTGAAPAAAPAASGLTDNVAGALAYVTIIPAILFLVMEPYNKNRFIRFHAFQCLFFAAAMIAMWIAFAIVATILAFIPFLGHLIDFLLWLVLALGGFIVVIVLIMKAYQGQMFKLPVIGDMAEKQANAV